MKITIHRGINQIGGCITEIATEKVRIIIDLGQSLPDNEGNNYDPFDSKEAIEKLCNGVDAVFYTHYHGDHFGHFYSIPDKVKQYIGATAQKIALRKYKQLSLIPDKKAEMERAMEKIRKMLTFTDRNTINIGDIKIKPFFVSHSAYDSYMFIIEAQGKRIVHTGDFRDHGFLSKKFYQAIDTRILSRGKVDLLITEGTMISRLDEEVKTEWQIQSEAQELMKKYKNVFVLCSSTDLERLAGFKKSVRLFKNRLLVGDGFQKDILKIFTDEAAPKSQVWDFGKVYDFCKTNEKLVKKMIDYGFCMFVRPTQKFEDYLNFLLPKLNPDETVLIYSMWKEYVNPANKAHRKENYLELLSRFANVKELHTSGHASPKCLARVCNKINPEIGIIPIHSEYSENFRLLPLTENMKEKIITTSQNIGDIKLIITDSGVNGRKRS